MRSLLFVLLFLFLSYIKTTGQSSGNNQPHWIYVTSEKGERWFVRSEYVTKTLEGIKIWVSVENMVYKKKGVNYKNCQMKELITVDCENKRLMHIETVIYNSSGNIINNYAPESYELEWNNVVPGSIGEFMLDKICKLFNN